MYCGISGETPTEPVLAKTSGQIYERSLIEKYIATHNKCPITGEPLSVDDLITVHGNKIVKPRPAGATSIPGMLQLFQNEWDSQMLETFNLKQQLDATRQELAHALYQNDAARRVIARLIRERDEARSLLANAGANGVALAPNGGAPVDNSLTPAILERMERLQGELLKGRKTRPCTVVPKETVRAFESKNSWPLHKTTQAGITCLAIHPSRKQLVLTGGNDKTAILYDRSTEKKVATLVGHTKRVSRVALHPVADTLLTASEDKTVRIWSPAGSSYRAVHVLSHEAAVTGLSLHPLGDYALTSGQDGVWAIHDINAGTTLTKVNDAANAAFTSASFHPDGLLLGTGDANGVVRVWDVKSQQVIASFEGHSSPVKFAFSENGYQMMSLSADNIKLWDVRKPNPIKSYDFAPGFDASALDIDYSATYVAVAGAAVRVLLAKTLEPVTAFEQHKKPVTDVKWTRDSSELASVSLDRNLVIYSA